MKSCFVGLIKSQLRSRSVLVVKKSFGTNQGGGLLSKCGDGKKCRGGDQKSKCEEQQPKCVEQRPKCVEQAPKCMEKPKSMQKKPKCVEPKPKPGDKAKCAEKKPKCGEKQKVCAPPEPPSQPQIKIEQRKAAIVLSGCGHLDGSCIIETASVAINLSRAGILPLYFAPSGPQTDVVNHYTGKCMEGERCVLTEAARLARGNIQDLSELQYCDVSCAIFPGGSGIIKTFTTFEKDKECCSIDVEVMRVLEEFHDARKPMAFLCIAAILPARMFPLVKVTLGMKGKPDLWPYQFLMEIAAKMGAEIENREVDGHSFDKQHMVFTTPAFLYNGTTSQIYDGITGMMQNMVKYLE